MIILVVFISPLCAWIDAIKWETHFSNKIIVIQALGYIPIVVPYSHISMKLLTFKNLEFWKWFSCCIDVGQGSQPFLLVYCN
jgi:hypothetical protein